MPLISYALVAIILCEGRMSLRFDELKEAGPGVTRLGTAGGAIAWFTGSVAAHFVGRPFWPGAVVSAAVIIMMDTIDRLPQTGDNGGCLKQRLKDRLVEHRQYIKRHGRDLPEIRHWLERGLPDGPAFDRDGAPGEGRRRRPRTA